MPTAEIENLIMMIAVVIVSGKKALPTPEFYIDTENGETGRYYVSSDNYLCHYGNASMLCDPTFSTQCFKQNKDNLSRLENKSKTYPYFDSSVDAPPGCGPLPIVKDGKWECPDGVSPLSVPVYESCRILSKGDSVQTRIYVRVRCTEKLELEMVFVEKSSGEHRQDPDILKVSLTIGLVFAVAVLILFCVFQKFKRHICNNLRKLLCNTLFQGNNVALNSVDTAGLEVEDPQQIILTKNTAKYKVSSSNSNVEKELMEHVQNNSTLDQCTCDSNGTLQTRDLMDIDISQETTFNNLNISNARTRVDSMSNPNVPIYNGVDQLNENVEPNLSLPLSQLLASNDETNASVISSMKTDLRNVKEDKEFVESFLRTQNELMRAEPCPTIAAMLEGAVDDSIRFVDDLSTLLDPDNPRNWQDLAQSYFNLSFNKIKEIRHKTKDHFKEAILPLLSSHGFSIFDLTYYFYKLPSRRIDVIECIQRYHPYCRDCGEIYSCLKSRTEK